jgi:hypothetical protein
MYSPNTSSDRHHPHDVLLTLKELSEAGCGNSATFNILVFKKMINTSFHEKLHGECSLTLHSRA